VKVSSITLEDVKLAIKIIQEFLREYRKAQLTLRQVVSALGVERRGRVEDKIVEMILSRQIQSTQREEAIETEQLTEEDVQKFRKIVEKYKEGERK